MITENNSFVQVNRREEEKKKLTGASFILSSATAVGTILLFTRSTGWFSWGRRFWFRGIIWSTVCLYANSFRGSPAAAVSVVSTKTCGGEGRDIVVLGLGIELPGIKVFWILRTVWREGWTGNLDRGLRGVEKLGRTNVLLRPREEDEVWVLTRWDKGDDFWRGLLFFKVEELDKLKGRCWRTEDVASDFSREDWIVGVASLRTLPVRSVLLLQGDSASGDDEDLWDRFLFPVNLMGTFWLGESEVSFCVRVSLEIVSFKAFLVASICRGTAWRSGSKGKTADTIVPCLSSNIWMAWIWVWRAWECDRLNCEFFFRKH